MSEPLRIGGLGPLSPPGVVPAGEELRRGMSLAVDDCNAGGGVFGRRVELDFRDTAGEPIRGVKATRALAASGAAAIVGEFHSVVADAIADARAFGPLPFICSSATLDRITERRLPQVFRLSPPQSHGWRVYAEALLARGFRQVLALSDGGTYWDAGAAVIESTIRGRGRFVMLPTDPAEPPASALERVTRTAATRPGASILLLLVAYPQPLGGLVQAASSRRDLSLSLGDPAGRPIFPDWRDVVGDGAMDVSYLSYLPPGGLSALGEDVALRFAGRHERAPTFVALEGYDALSVTIAALTRAGTTEPLTIIAALRELEVPCTRGTIRFTTERSGVVHQQWRWPPTQVAWSTSD